MTGSIEWRPRLHGRIPNGKYYSAVKGPRVGVLLHFDASGSDEGALSWFGNPKCGVSYNALALDDGSYATVAPWTAAAWHAGKTRSSDPARLPYATNMANHALYGIAATTNERIEVTALQLMTVAFLARCCFEKEGWPLTQLWRITGHENEAWPRGRKSDPTGPLKQNPIMSVANVRQLVPLFTNVQVPW